MKNQDKDAPVSALLQVEIGKWLFLDGNRVEYEGVNFDLTKT